MLYTLVLAAILAVAITLWRWWTVPAITVPLVKRAKLRPRLTAEGNKSLHSANGPVVRNQIVNLRYRINN